MAMQILKVRQEDRAVYLALSEEFYTSGAALIRATEAARVRTFDELMRSDVYAEAFLFLVDGAHAGFMLLAKTFSQEIGGMVLWIEELFIRPAYRGCGIGSAAFAFLRARYGDSFLRMRLEIEPENEGARRLYVRWGFDEYPYEQMKLDL